MANILDRNTDFLTNGTVTAAGLHNLIDDTNIYAGLISTQEEKTTVGTADLLLIADSSSIGSPQIAANRTTVYNLFDDALSVGTYTGLNLTGALTYGTATGNRTISTSATITTGTIPNLTSSTANITLGTIPTLTAGTTTSTAANITNGTVQTLTASTATITSGTYGGLINSSTGTFSGSINSTAGTIGTLNSTTGTITNISTTLAGDFTISQGTGTLGTTGVVAGTYGTSTIIPRISVDAKGRITTLSTAALGSTGKVLQVVSATTSSVVTCGTTIPWDDTIPQITEGNEVLNLTITPLSATSVIYIKFDASGSASGAVTNAATIAFFKDSAANAIYATQVHFWNASNYGNKFNASYKENSSSTTSRTYRVRVGADSPTIYINGNFAGTRRYGGVSTAILEIWEVEV